MPAKLAISAAHAPVGALKNDDAARYIGLAPGTLNNMRAKGEGPRWTKLGRIVVYRIVDLDAYLAAHVVGGVE